MIEYVYDDTVPKRIKKFFEKFLTHSKGTHANKPFVLLDWQYDIINQLYGIVKLLTNIKLKKKKTFFMNKLRFIV